MRTTENHCFRELYKWVTLLVNKHHIPIVVSYRDSNKKQKFYGSKNAKRNAKSHYSKSISTQKAFDSDYNDLNLPGTLGHISYEPVDAFFSASSEKETEIERLPYKLEWMRHQDICPYVTREIMRQYHLRGGKDVKPGFGKKEFKPALWPDDIWSWDKVTNFSNAKFPRSKGTLTKGSLQKKEKSKGEHF